jgi:hypothetical protein
MKASGHLNWSSVASWKRVNLLILLSFLLNLALMMSLIWCWLIRLVRIFNLWKRMMLQICEPLLLNLLHSGHSWMVICIYKATSDVCRRFQIASPIVIRIIVTCTQSTSWNSRYIMLWCIRFRMISSWWSKLLSSRWWVSSIVAQTTGRQVLRCITSRGIHVI